MNCRTFQKDLEDYLENGLDFAGRFGMERHARQCIRCGKELADAQKLSGLVHNLTRVKAPPDFESLVLNEIGARKMRRRFSGFRRFLVFGFDMLSWRQYAWAASVAVALCLGFFYQYNTESSRNAAGTALTSNDPAGADLEEPANNGGISPLMTREALNINGEPYSDRIDDGLSLYYQPVESDYGEYPAIGPDNLPMILPLPNTIRMQVGVPSEEYFIRNVSH